MMSWENKTIRLGYRFGFISVTEVRMNAIIPTSHFSSFPADLVDNPPVAALSDKQAGVAFIASCPLKGDEPTLSYCAGHVRYISCRYPHYIIDSTGSFSDYMQKHLSKRTRKGFRSKVRTFEKESGGTIDWRIYSTVDEITDFYEQARRISEKTYIEKWLKRGLPADEQFQENMRRSAEAGNARGYLIFLDGKPVAYNYGEIVDGSVLVVDYGGYDPEYGELSPGAVLDFVMMEKTFDIEQIRVIDLGEGEADYKRRFSTASNDCGDLFFFKVSPKNAVVVGSHFVFQQSYEKMRYLIDAWELKPYLNKILKR